jgi:hypothetical protein
MIDLVADEMGAEISGRCYPLARFQEMLQGMKSCSNSEILRQLGETRKVFDPATCEQCGKCGK